MQKFGSSVCTTSLQHELPYGCYEIQFRTNCSKCSSAVERILRSITSYPCRSLTILHKSTINSAFDREGHRCRINVLKFVSLCAVTFRVVFDARFTPDLRSSLENAQQRRIAANILLCLTRPRKSFRALAELELLYPCLEDRHLEILSSGLCPIKALTVGYWTSSVRTKQFSMDSLHKFLDTQSQALNYSNLKFQLFRARV